MTTTDIAVAMRRHLIWIVAATLFATLGGLYASAKDGPEYESRTRVLVGPMIADFDTLRASAELTRIYAELVTSDSVLTSAIAALGFSEAPEELAEAIEASADPATRIITITVEDGDAGRAGLIADELGDQLVVLGTQAPGEGLLRVVSAGSVGDSGTVPSRLPVVVAGLSGLVTSVIAVVLLEGLRDPIRGAQDVAGLTNSPILATLPRQGRPGELTTRSRPHSARGAALFSLAMKLYLQKSPGTRTLLVVEVPYGIGAADVAANVAWAMAKGGQRVALVDADDLTGSLTSLLELSDEPGIGELTRLPETAISPSVNSYLHFPEPDLKVLPIGGVAPPITLPQIYRDKVIKSMEEHADRVLVNSGPLHGGPGALGWASTADAALIVVHPWASRRRDLAATLQTLRHLELPVAGVVLDHARPRRRATYVRRASPSWTSRGSEAIATAHGAPPALESASTEG